MKRLAFLSATLLLACLAAPEAEAGGYYGGDHYRGGYYGAPRHGVRHYGYRSHGYRPYGYRSYGYRPYGYRSYGHPYRYGHHGHDRGRYAAAGLIVGLALGNVLTGPQPRVVERRVYTAPRTTTVYRERAAVEPPVIADETRPALGYRLARDGTCWYLDETEDGRTVATEVAPEECG